MKRKTYQCSDGHACNDRGKRSSSHISSDTSASSKCAKHESNVCNGALSLQSVATLYYIYSKLRASSFKLQAPAHKQMLMT
jgi:hypothetical protein